MKRVVQCPVKPLQLFTFIVFFVTSVYAQTIEDISFGTDESFEVVTWNIERFPKNGQTSIDYVARIIKAIDADVYAIQEVNNINDFNDLVNSLDDYEGYLDSDKFRGLAYIYRKSTIDVNSVYEIYNSSSYSRPFPRYPMVLDFDYKGERMIIINNHFKCCGDGTFEDRDDWDEETRRNEASTLLKEYIDANFTDLNVMLVGDLNDVLTDQDIDNVFKVYLDDPDNYKFADIEIANGASSAWSFPTWPSHLDHILITNELFDEYKQEDTVVEVLKLEEYISGGWGAYDSNITDHRPVALKFKINETLYVEEQRLESMRFVNYPNPFTTSTTFSFPTANEKGTLGIYTLTGQLVSSTTIAKGQRLVTIQTKELPAGIYMAKIAFNKKQSATLKLIVTD